MKSLGSKTTVTVVIIIVLLILGYFGYKKMWNKEGDGYSLVYLQTGQIYVGKLTTFPRLKMTNGYFLSVTAGAEGEKDTFQLVPLSEAVWAPQDLYINESNVMFYGTLDDTSPAADALKKAGK